MTKIRPHIGAFEVSTPPSQPLASTNHVSRSGDRARAVVRRRTLPVNDSGVLATAAGGLQYRLGRQT